jgi:cytochrome c
MSTRSAILIAASGLAMASAVTFAAESPNLGRVAMPEEIAAWDISIGPNGVGLPPGSGTPKQGEAVYAAKCVACHGENGAGKPNDQLVGGNGSLPGGKPPVKTVGSFWPYATTVFDYVRRAMPYNESKSLTNDEVYAVVAYILTVGRWGGRHAEIAANERQIVDLV